MPMTTDAPRRASRADIPACAGIVAAWERATDWLPGETPPAEVIADYIAEAFEAREIWVIGDPVAGYASIDPAACRLGALYCAAPGRGHGKALMDRAKAGRDRLTLTTHEPNIRAQAFYRREGFAVLRRLPGTPPHDSVPLIEMGWRA